MNKLIKLLPWVLISCLITFIIGWRVGVHQGFEVETELHESMQITPLVSELSLLREHKYDELILSKEMQLDTAVSSYARYLEDRRRWMIYPFNMMSKPILEDSIRLCAAYRSKYPRKGYGAYDNPELKELQRKVDSILKNVK